MSAYETQGFKVDNSGKRVVVDPVCRIEGQKAEVNSSPVCRSPMAKNLGYPVD